MATARPYIATAYIQFPTGRLSLIEIQQIFSTIPFEIDLIDHTDHFAWYSDKPNREHVRKPEQLGESVQECHPKAAWPIVEKIINSFKDGSKDMVSRPLTMHGQRVLISYYALRDVDGKYLGTIEFTGSVEPILAAYDNGGWSDSSTGASQATSHEPDANTGASTHPATGVASDSGTVDGNTGASEEDTPAGPANDAGVADADTGASEG